MRKRYLYTGLKNDGSGILPVLEIMGGELSGYAKTDGREIVLEGNVIVLHACTRRCVEFCAGDVFCSDVCVYQDIYKYGQYPGNVPPPTLSPIWFVLNL